MKAEPSSSGFNECKFPPILLAARLRRFHNSLTGNQRWIRERSHESYAKNYSVVFPFDEPLASRNMRKDPFHQVGEGVGVFSPRVEKGEGGSDEVWRCTSSRKQPLMCVFEFV